MSSGNSNELDIYLEEEEKGHRAFQRGTFQQLAKIVFKNHLILFSGLLMVLFGTVATLLEPRIFGFAIDEAIIPRNLDRLRMIAGVFFIVITVRVVSSILQGYFFEILGQRVTQDLRLMLFSHLERMPVSVFDKNPAGRLLTRVTNDVSTLGEMFTSGFVSIITNILMVVGILVWLISLDVKLGLIGASIFPALTLLSVYFSKRLKAAYRTSRSKLAALNGFLAENLFGMKVVNLFNRQKLHFERFSRLNNWYADAQVSSIRVFALFQPSISISSGISISLIIWFGGNEALNGTLKVGVLVAYFSYALSLFQPVREIADKWNVFLSGMTSAERIFSLLAWPTELDPESVLTEACPIENLQGEIVFENVWFAYENSNWIFKDFCLRIKPGEKIGIVGHTGSGKSTLIHLLMRFYEPQKGRILIDGKDIRTFNKRSLRASIGMVQQEVFLFSGSFTENITFWNQNRAHEVHSLLSNLGIRIRKESDSVLERGSNLSMGERQVIAFARALASHPKIWILDEATANLDSTTESLLQDALNSASQRLTTILVAHRLATVRSADRILVLHKGSLVEFGSHDDLMMNDGLYARLFRLQEMSH